MSAELFVSELVRRDFRITKRVLERYDYTVGCPGCNAALSNPPRREHNKECRERIEAQMHEDPEDLVRIIERDIRLEPPSRDDEPSPEEGSPDSVEEGQRPPISRVWMLESDVEDNVLYGPEEDPRAAHTPSSSSGTRRGRPPADEEVTDEEMRRLLGMDEDVRTILSKLVLRSCDGVGQKLTKMIANMTDEQVQNKVKTQDVTKIIEAAQQISDKPTLHDDQQWEDFYWNVVLTDDVNKEKVLDKDKVIKARVLEMDFFTKMGVHKKVDRGEVKKNKGKIVSTKWVDTDRGHGGYRSRLVGREIKRDQRQDLFSPTPLLEVPKLLIAHCAKNQRTDNPKRIGVINVSRAYFYIKCKRAPCIQIPDEDWEPGDEERVGELVHVMRLRSGRRPIQSISIVLGSSRDAGPCTTSIPNLLCTVMISWLWPTRSSFTG